MTERELQAYDAMSVRTQELLDSFLKAFARKSLKDSQFLNRLLPQGHDLAAQLRRRLERVRDADVDHGGIDDLHLRKLKDNPEQVSALFVYGVLQDPEFISEADAEVCERFGEELPLQFIDFLGFNPEVE